MSHSTIALGRPTLRRPSKDPPDLSIRMKAYRMLTIRRAERQMVGSPPARLTAPLPFRSPPARRPGYPRIWKHCPTGRGTMSKRQVRPTRGAPTPPTGSISPPGAADRVLKRWRPIRGRSGCISAPLPPVRIQAPRQGEKIRIDDRASPLVPLVELCPARSVARPQGPPYRNRHGRHSQQACRSAPPEGSGVA